MSLRFSTRSILATAVALALGLASGPAQAQIKSPGAHPKYNVELEPHFVFQVDDRPFTDDGVGIGIRGSIPVIQSGPISTINNNLAIGFGLDWAHFSSNCHYLTTLFDYGCSGDSVWLPVVAQWNFFFTPVVSAYAELGLGIQHWSARYDCPAGPNINCGSFYSRSGTDVYPVLAVGPRFMLTDTFGINVRIGTPHITLGASILL